MGRTSFVDTRDVAAVAAMVLGDPAPHAGLAYTLTGPAALDYHRVASMLSAELKRVIVYDPRTLLSYRQMVINLVARLGLAGRVTDTLGRLLGRPPTTLATYLHDRRDCWAATS